MKRVLVVIEENEYRMPMLPDEKPEAAVERYMTTGPDNFYSATRERDAWLEDEQGNALPDEVEVP
jgi:hypothetical protein